MKYINLVRFSDSLSTYEHVAIVVAEVLFEGKFFAMLCPPHSFNMESAWLISWPIVQDVRLMQRMAVFQNHYSKCGDGLRRQPQGIGQGCLKVSFYICCHLVDPWIKRSNQTHTCTHMCSFSGNGVYVATAQQLHSTTTKHPRVLDILNQTIHHNNFQCYPKMYHHFSEMQTKQQKSNQHINANPMSNVITHSLQFKADMSRMNVNAVLIIACAACTTSTSSQQTIIRIDDDAVLQHLYTGGN